MKLRGLEIGPNLRHNICVKDVWEETAVRIKYTHLYIKKWWWRCELGR